MAEPATACAWSDLAACLASGEVVAAVVAGVVLGLPAALFALLRLARWIVRRWRKFWGRRPARLFGFEVDDRPPRGQMLRSWQRELWPRWLRRCWRPLLAVVRRLLLPRG